MANLYWRVKVGGTWTYRRAIVIDEDDYDVIVLRHQEEEE